MAKQPGLVLRSAAATARLTGQPIQLVSQDLRDAESLWELLRAAPAVVTSKWWDRLAWRELAPSQRSVVCTIHLGAATPAALTVERLRGLLVEGLPRQAPQQVGVSVTSYWTGSIDVSFWTRKEAS